MKIIQNSIENMIKNIKRTKQNLTQTDKEIEQISIEFYELRPYIDNNIALKLQFVKNLRLLYYLFNLR